ncbi:hypothetical protein [Terrimonas ferruginea]|uniref:hypothetical protein n=1 Tax=Terrimonas ferruginea TaxID=249 RepID=UPI0004066D72|nr:hypothetical protein [Terrimonas ferruginea]
MKKHLMSLSAALLLIGITACSNEEKKTETPATPPAQSKAPPPPPAQKTEISVGPDGASVKNKDGTKVSMDKKGAEVVDKKTDIKIKTPQ